MKKKIIKNAMLAAAVCILFGAGCKEKSNSYVYDENDGTVTLKVVTMFGANDSNAPVYNEINRAFMEEYPNVIIDDDSQKSDEEWKLKIAADFATGNEPDVLHFFTDAVADMLIATNKLVTLEEIRKEYPEYASNIPQESIEVVRNTDGVCRAVPINGYWEGLYCNKDLFEEYNIPLPTDWDSLVNAIQKFREHDIIPVACSLSNIPHYWIEHLLLYTLGEEEYVKNLTGPNEGWVKALETFKTLRDMGAFPDDTDSVDDEYAGQLFTDKRAAMQLDGSWLLNRIENQEGVIVIPFPGVEDQKATPGAAVGGISSGFYITKKAWDDPEKRETAVNYIMAQASDENITKYWNGSGISVIPQEAPDGMSPLGISGMKLSTSATSFSAATDARLGEAYKILTEGIVKVSKGEMEAEELVEKVWKENVKKLKK